jgi:hypothetical protein
LTADPSKLPDPRLGEYAVAVGLTDDGREVVVQWRPYNTTISIGPAGKDWFDDFW